MKKIIYMILFLFTISTVFTGCREKKENSVEEVIDETGDAVEDATDEAGDAIEDAADEVEDEVE